MRVRVGSRRFLALAIVAVALTDVAVVVAHDSGNPTAVTTRLEASRSKPTVDDPSLGKIEPSTSVPDAPDTTSSPATTEPTADTASGSDEAEPAPPALSSGSCPPVAPVAMSAVTDPGLYVVDEDGSDLHRLVAGAFGVRSPDGRQIAFVQAAVDGLCLGPADGGASRLVPIAEELTELHRGLPIVWSPDSMRLAVMVTHNSRDLFPTDVLVVNVDTGIVTRADQAPPGRQVAADWSPDGSRLAVARDDVITIADPDGTDAVTIPVGDDVALGALQWTADGSSIVTRTIGAQVVLVAADGSGVRAVGQQAFMFDWSLFNVGVVNWADQIVVVMPDGTTHVASNAIGSAPRWTSDGRIVFAHPMVRANDTASLVSAASDGSGEHVIVALPPSSAAGDPQVSAPQVQPAHGEIVFSFFWRPHLGGSG